MIKVNYYEIPFDNKITVSELIELLKKDSRFTWVLSSNYIVLKNDKMVSEESFGDEIVEDGDEIRVYPQVMGG